MESTTWDLIVIGGGAAGFFGAITAAEAQPGLRVLILERGKTVLTKVKISGGGRCNLTHACWEPRELVKAYPRGQRELRGPFHHFAPGDTLRWFEQRGIMTHTEADGRIFPLTNDSQTIVDCLTQAAQQAGVELRTRSNVTALRPQAEGWEVSVAGAEPLSTRQLLVTTGSNSRMWELLAELGHQVVPPVPSLFTFNVADPRLQGLAGLAVPHAVVTGAALQGEGPLLVTHWGLSGPAVLKISAWAARELHACAYAFDLRVNWWGQGDEAAARGKLEQARQALARKQLRSSSPFEAVPQRLWERLGQAAGIPGDRRWADLRKAEAQALAQEVAAGTYAIRGKSTFKEEFVTAGGVDLAEVDFRRFSSRKLPGLYLAGEVLDIDAVTGGYNFQAAWTGGYLAGQAIAGDAR